MAVKGQLKPKYKLKLNSLPKIEELLQEMYDEVEKNKVDIQTQMNKLQSSVNLNDETMDSKVRFAKAMNDFIVSKDKAFGKILEIAKLMAEIHKYQGNLEEAMNAKNENIDWTDLKQKLAQEMSESSNEESTILNYK